MDWISLAFDTNAGFGRFPGRSHDEWFPVSFLGLQGTNKLHQMKSKALLEA